MKLFYIYVQCTCVFYVDILQVKMYLIVVALFQFPDGFSPPPSPDIVPSIEQPPPRGTTDTG